ncbi:MAG TPA: heavy-metal-associated domain-containing protein [Firmicutes bacterium]|nr:heavy-metal-associated domain-containing protein [Bacillota bacterium]
MGCCSGGHEEHREPVGTGAGDVTTQVKAAGMSCQHCVMAVKKRVGNLPGVKDVKVDLTTGLVTVTHSAAGPDREVIRGAIREAGYEPEN